MQKPRSEERAARDVARASAPSGSDRRSARRLNRRPGAPDTMDSRSGRDECGAAADLAIGVGRIGAAGSAITGPTDWSETDEPARNIGLLHDRGLYR